MTDRITDFSRGQRLTTKFKCPYCPASGMDLRILREQRIQETLPDVIRKYQRIKCLACGKLFIYWWDKKRVRKRQEVMFDSIPKVEPLSEEEKLRRWMDG